MDASFLGVLGLVLTSSEILMVNSIVALSLYSEQRLDSYAYIIAYATCHISMAVYKSYLHCVHEEIGEKLLKPSFAICPSSVPQNGNYYSLSNNCHCIIESRKFKLVLQPLLLTGYHSLMQKKMTKCQSPMLLLFCKLLELHHRKIIKNAS